MTPLRQAPWLGLFMLLLILPACSSPKKEEGKPKSMPPALVVTAAVKAQDVPIEIKTFGTMEASESVTIKPMLSGELITVGFKEGQDVEQGALLFTIDPRPYQAALNKAQASQARNRILRENALRDYERYSKLVKEGIVTQEQAEGYRTRAETAEADLAADLAAVESAKTQLSYCTISAPISGRLGVLTVDRGNVIKANETALVTINKLTPINATFTIPERDLPAVKERLAQGSLTLTAEVPGTTDVVEQGTVSFLDNAVDVSTGTIRLKGEFANSQKRLWPGQFVTLILTLETRRGAVVVPTQAILTGQKGPFVFVVTPEESAEVRPVVSGTAYQGVTVIDKGLKPGEQVVVDGQMRVIPGGKIQIKGEKKAEKGGKGEGAGAPSSDKGPGKGEAAGR